MKVLIVYYSMYGHIHRMAEAVAQGAEKVEGAFSLCQSPDEFYRTSG